MPSFLTKPQAPQGPTKFAPESQALPDPWIIKASEGLAGAMGFGDDSKASRLGELVSATAPFVGPALKGLGVAAPLISIYKDAAGVPSTAMREAGTQNFLEMAKDLPGKLQIAAERFAQRYPRIAAHMHPSVGSAPESIPDASAFVSNWPGQVKAPLETVFTPSGISSIENRPGMQEATRQMWHEGTHVAQHLGNRDYPDLYRATNQLVGYDLNPFESRANRAGTLAAGGMVTRGSPTAIDQLRFLSEYSNEPAARSIKNTLLRRAGVPNEPYEGVIDVASRPR